MQSFLVVSDSACWYSSAQRMFATVSSRSLLQQHFCLVFGVGTHKWKDSDTRLMLGTWKLQRRRCSRTGSHPP